MEILGNSRHLQCLQYSFLPSFLMTGTEPPQVLQSPGRIPGAEKWPVKSVQTVLSAGLHHFLGTTFWRSTLYLTCLLSSLTYLLPWFYNLTLLPDNHRGGDRAWGQEKMPVKILKVYRCLLLLCLQGRGEHRPVSLVLLRAHGIAAPQVLHTTLRQGWAH